MRVESFTAYADHVLREVAHAMRIPYEHLLHAFDEQERARELKRLYLCMPKPVDPRADADPRG